MTDVEDRDASRPPPGKPGTGSAAEAIAAAEAFLARQQPRASAEDWRRVLEEIRRALQTVAASDLVRADPVATGIVAEMAHAQDMAEIDFLVDMLNARVRVLVEARSGEPAPPPAPPATPVAAEARRRRVVLKI
ncbi:hypothetical protein [Prosthecomicrobium sp. N25]|uniref:hypothetical protein n=1 Tax=Prosthecomicrobium sp. N25 TaxID=3129254 RepID=UPI00307738AE